MDSETLEFLADLEKSELVVDNENEATVPSGERPCPICGKQMMVDDEFGISVDVCEQHGIWLDRGELLSIIMRARSGDRISRRAAMKRAKDEGKIVGSMLGLWSLLLD